MRHQLKRLAREIYARALWHSGLWRIVDRCMPRRLTILAGHCVASEAVNGGLPADMKISAAKLEGLLARLGRRWRLCTVGEGARALEEGPGPSLVALSMDDGYRDNLTELDPLLARVGGRATVFLESRPLDERRVNWSHKYFWLLERQGAESLGRELAARAGEPLRGRIERALAGGGDRAYQVKRVLKYEAPAAERDGVLDALFVEGGGDERALCDRLYLSWDQARALRDGGRVELGGHTVSHEVLSTLAPEAARAEIEAGRAALARELGRDALESFAYPFGRRWDFDPAAAEAVLAAGFRVAVTTHAGTNVATTDRARFARWMLDEGTPLHLLAAEACGGFALLRRLGIELAE